MFTVVLAADGNDARVLAQARAIVAYPNAPESVKVVVVHVSREVQSDEGGEIHTEDYSELPDSVSQAIKFFEREGITAQIEHRSGDPDEEILRVARDIDADQIVLGGRRRSPVGKAIFGSVVQNVIRNSTRPVLTINTSK